MFTCMSIMEKRKRRIVHIKHWNEFKITTKHNFYCLGTTYYYTCGTWQQCEHETTIIECLGAFKFADSEQIDRFGNGNSGIQQ